MTPKLKLDSCSVSVIYVRNKSVRAHQSTHGSYKTSHAIDEMVGTLMQGKRTSTSPSIAVDMSLIYREACTSPPDTLPREPASEVLKLKASKLIESQGIQVN